MSFLPYGSEGAGGWIGAFTVSGVAHAAIISGMVTIYNQTLLLADLDSRQAAFDISVALEQLDDVEPVVEADPEPAEDDLPPLETIASTTDAEQVAPTTTVEDLTVVEAATDSLAAVEDAAVAQVAETETLQAAAEEVPEAPADAIPDPVADPAPVEAPVETLAPDPFETALLAPEPEAPAGPGTGGPLVDDAAIDSPLDSPLEPDDGGLQTIAPTGPGSGGFDTGAAPVPVPVAPTPAPVTPTGTPSGPDVGTLAAVPQVDTTVGPITAGTDTGLVVIGEDTGVIEATIDALPSPGEDILRPAPPADRGPGGAATGSAAAPPSPQDIALTDLIRRVRQVEADPCLAALPRRDGAEGVGLALMARDEAAMEAFSAAFVTPADDGLRQTRALLDQRQCAAVSYIRNNVDYPATRLGLRLDNDLVPSGGRLTGVVRGTPGKRLLLLLIDDNGVVQDLQRFTSTSGDFYRFDVPVNRVGAARDSRNILMALTFSEDPAPLRDRLGLVAQDVFSGLPGTLAEGADMAVATFDVR